MQKVYLLRHGHSTLTGKYVGSTDCSLSVQGQDQVLELSHKKIFSSAQHVLSSPMLRCQQTYQGLGMDISVEYNENLREIDFGLWEGLDFSQVYSTYRSEFDSWCHKPQNFCFPNGESIAHFEKRLNGIPEYIKCLEGDVLVVAHGGVIRHLLCLFLGFSPLLAMKLQIDVAHYAVIDIFGDDCILSTLNHN